MGSSRRRVPARRDSKLLYRGAELADRRHDLDRRVAHYPFLRNQIIRLFGQAKVEKLKQEKQFLKRFLKLEKRAHFAGFIPLEDVLGAERDLAVAETEIHNLERFSTVFQPVSLPYPGLLADDLPVPQLDLAALREAISKASLEEEALQLEQEQASTRYSSINDIRLRPFVRYRVRDSQNLRRDDVSVGVSLSIPFPFPSRNSRGMREIELEVLATKRKRQNLRRQAEMMGFFYEYREKVEDWLATRYQLAAIEEGLRCEVAKADLADPKYQLRDSVLILRDLGKTELRLLDIKQILYLKLAGIFQFLPDEDVSCYFSGVFEPEIDSHRNRARPGTRSIFLSSTTRIWRR